MLKPRKRDKMVPPITEFARPWACLEGFFHGFW